MYAIDGYVTFICSHGDHLISPSHLIGRYLIIQCSNQFDQSNDNMCFLRFKLMTQQR